MFTTDSNKNWASIYLPITVKICSFNVLKDILNGLKNLHIVIWEENEIVISGKFVIILISNIIK